MPTTSPRRCVRLHSRGSIRRTAERVPAPTDVDFRKCRNRLGAGADGKTREQRAVHQRRPKTRQAVRPLGIHVGFLEHNQAQPDHVSIRIG